ncbi:MAG TPA: MFS transporter [Thermoanaerobaculia bacterium]|jgi:EmrB/QacA subfamily drug resistance transporter
MTRALPALAALSLCILLSALGTSIANVALPAVAATFGVSIQQVQWIVLAYLLSITTLIVSVGRLADLAGRRRMLLAGIALFVVASIACGLAPTLGALIAARAVQGLGAAAMMALAMPFVADTVAKEKSGSAMGLLGTTSAVGTALGPSLGGVLIAQLGWRAVFLAPVPLALLAGVLAWRTLPADRAVASQRERFDAAGTLLLAVTLASYALAMSGRTSLFLAAFAGLALFIRVEAKAESPLLRLELFADRARSAAFATNALVTTVVMATLVVGPFYLADALALDAARIGLVLSAGPVVAALAGVPSGAMVDRFGTRRTTIAALGIMMTGCAVLSQMPPRFGIPGYLAPLVTITAGYALFQAANNTAVMADVPGDRRGVVSGMLNLSRNLGLITGASLMAAIFGAAGMRVTFAVAAGMAGLALGVAYWENGRIRQDVGRSVQRFPRVRALS